MNTFQRIFNLVAYEWRRSLAKKKIYVLIALALALQIGIFALFNFFFTSPTQGPNITGPFLEGVKGTMWLLGVLGPQGLFIPLIAIIVAGGSMSEEYEHGTADILLSKPITRVEYLAGKYLGGLSLIGFVIVLITILGTVLARGFFGPQESLQIIPAVYMALVYANLLFFSLAFMLSEALRRTTLAYLVSIGIFIASMIVGGYLSILYAMTREQFYLDISRWLPNWSASNFPSFVVSELMTVQNSPFISVVSGDVRLAAAIIAVYSVVSVLVATVRLVKSDITKRGD